MFDYTYFRDNGTRCYVADMTTAEVNMALEEFAGLELNPTVVPEGLLERLRIELLIRQLAL